MDNGEEIPGLNENWTFLGAKPSEWFFGFLIFMILKEVFFKGDGQLGRAMPILLVSCVGGTIGMASLRMRYPDEERGLFNHLCVILGFKPPKIPEPASLKDRWSGFPLRELEKKTYFRQLGLDEVFNKIDNFEEDTDSSPKPNRNILDERSKF